MNMKKRWTLLLMIGVVCLGGCGKESDSADKDGKTKELEVFSSKAENQEILQNLVDGFNKSQEKVKIKLNAPADAETVLKTRLAKDEVPDILMFNYSNSMREILRDGFWKDWSEEPLAEYCYDEYKNILKADNEEESEALYALPYAANGGGVIYNVDKFEEKNLEIPETWDEMIAMMDALKAEGETPLLFPFKDIWTAEHPYTYIEGRLQPENFEEDKKAGKTTYVGTHEEISDHFLTLLDYAQEDYMGTSYNDANKAFANGDAYMMINGNWVIPEIKKANPDCNISMFAMPATNDKNENLISTGIDVMFAVSNDCSNVEGAKEFIEYMIQTEQAQKYMDDQFALSAVNTATQKDPTVAILQQYIEENKVYLFTNMQNPNGMDFGAALSAFCLNYSNGMDREEAIAEFLADTDSKFDTANAQ